MRNELFSYDGRKKASFYISLIITLILFFCFNYYVLFVLGGDPQDGLAILAVIPFFVIAFFLFLSFFLCIFNIIYFRDKKARKLITEKKLALSILFLIIIVMVIFLSFISIFNYFHVYNISNSEGESNSIYSMLFEKAVKNNNYPVIQNLAFNEALPEDLIYKIYDHAFFYDSNGQVEKEFYIFYGLASNPSTPTDILHELYTFSLQKDKLDNQEIFDYSAYLKVQLARNKNLPEDLISELGKYEGVYAEDVKYALNDNLSAKKNL